MYKFSRRMDGISGSAIREIFKLLANPNVISFAGGMPAKEAFPTQLVSDIAVRLMQEKGQAILQYGATEGWAPLRESLLELAKKNGNWGDGDEILTLTGSSQGLELTAKVFLDEGDVILSESPSFLGALQTFRTFKAVPIGVDMDDEGMVLSDLEEKITRHKAKVIYTIPTFQNPTGKTLPLERRKKLVELANKYDVIVLEDDPYARLRYSGSPIPNIKSLDTQGRVILLNSFSKVISPGLRVGYAVANSEIIRKMTIAKQGMDTHTSNLSQAIIDVFLRDNLLEPHLASVIPDYALRCNKMLDCIARYFPPSVKCTKPEGGLFIWAELAEGVGALEKLKAAIERDVAFIPGTHFFPDGSGANTIRLNFSASSPEQIEKGVKVLSEVFAG